MKEISRCTGHCCTDFLLPYSPIQIAFWKKWIAKGKRTTNVRGKWNNITKHCKDANNLKQVFDMVRFIRTDFTPPDKEARGLKKNKYKAPLNVLSARFYHYSCKNFDKETKKCTIYEDRPNMCRTHAAYGGCSYRDCTLRMKPQLVDGNDFDFYKKNRSVEKIKDERAL